MEGVEEMLLTLRRISGFEDASDPAAGLRVAVYDVNENLKMTYGKK